MSKRYFWLKLQHDFFERDDVKIIQKMENGKDYILFYLKLLVKSIPHQGHLRLNDLVPYNEEMLSTITGVNIDVVRSACKVFTNLNLMEVLEDGTIFLLESEAMIGSECDSAARVREYRKSKLLLCNNDVTKSNLITDIDIDTDIKIKKEKEIKKSSKSPLKKYGEYKHVKLTDKQYSKFIKDFGEEVGLRAIDIADEAVEIRGESYYSYKNYNLVLRKWPVKQAQEEISKSSTESISDLRKKYGEKNGT